jgi:hypothetical protein
MKDKSQQLISKRIDDINDEDEQKIKKQKRKTHID